MGQRIYRPKLTWKKKHKTTRYAPKIRVIHANSTRGSRGCKDKAKQMNGGKRTAKSSDSKKKMKGNRRNRTCADEG